MSTFFNVRKIKISYIVCKSIWKRSTKPKITLSGDWIKKAGFEIGDDILIIAKNGELKIIKNQ